VVIDRQSGYWRSHCESVFIALLIVGAGAWAGVYRDGFNITVKRANLCVLCNGDFVRISSLTSNDTSVR
jgi:hypothetical protein